VARRRFAELYQREDELAVQRTLREICDAIGGTVVGDPDCVIHSVAGIDEAREGQITFIANPKYVRLLASTRASGVILPPGIAVPRGRNAIIHENPSMAFVKATSLFFPEPPKAANGISEKASIGKNVRLGKEVCIEDYAVIAEEVTVGENTRIGPFVYIGRDTEIGRDCLIYVSPHSYVSQRPNPQQPFSCISSNPEQPSSLPTRSWFPGSSRCTVLPYNPHHIP